MSIMHKVLMIGNPNVGKTTLFNSLTRSSEHTGNFHGVTVDYKIKNIKIENENFEFFDLPGLYSLNTISDEEELAKKIILNEKNATKIVVTDANSLSKNLYLCLQLDELGIDYKLVINNYDYFVSAGNKLNIKILQKYFGNDTITINAKKIKIDKNFFKFQKSNIKITYLVPFLTKIKEKFKFLSEIQILNAINSIYEERENYYLELKKFILNLLPDIINARYKFIEQIINEGVYFKQNFVYGKSKSDKVILNPFVMIFGFIFLFFIGIYLIFFLLGPIVSEGLIFALEFSIINPFMNFLNSVTSNVWIMEFFDEGIFGAICTVLTFLPQVCLLFMFLTILEDSGIIARMAYVFDDLLTRFGLNGKAVYIMLMGLGCNSMSALASRNMNGKNLKIKSAILSPYISCMARLPVYVLVAGALFGVKSYFVVAGLYLLGLFVSFIVALILEKTILKSKASELLLEFPPMRKIDIKHIFKVGGTNAIDMIKRIFGIVLSVSIIIYILMHTTFNFSYTSSLTNSILYIIADKISIIFQPIGLNNAGIVTALIVGILAKELIISVFSISNGVSSIAALSTSLITANSLVNFSVAGGVSFLIFSLLYSPCLSNLVVIKKETSSFWMWFSFVSQFTIAYLLSYFAYTAISHNIYFALISLLIIIGIIGAILFVVKKIRNKTIFNKCANCPKNNICKSIDKK